MTTTPLRADVGATTPRPPRTRDRTKTEHRSPLTNPADIASVTSGRAGDPFAILGPHETQAGHVIRTFQPGADAVRVMSRRDNKLLAQLTKEGSEGLFSGVVADTRPYMLQIDWPGATQE